MWRHGSVQIEMTRRQIDFVRRYSASSVADAAERALERRVASGAEKSSEERAARAIVENEGLESLSGSQAEEAFASQEAIILADLRPAYLIKNGKIELGDEVESDPALTELIRGNRESLEEVCGAVGRVDLVHHPTRTYAGTGWLIRRDVAVTNRHVARVFAAVSRRGVEFKTSLMGTPMEARLDYGHEYEQHGDRSRAEVQEILHVAAPGEPDIAFARVAVSGDASPIKLSTTLPELGREVAAIGYPGRDSSRNDPELMDRLFGGIYQVKRFSPGYVVGREKSDVVVTADYTSLAGSSGSAVIDLRTGKAVALHFAGIFGERNFAVASDIVAAALGRIESASAVVVPEESPTSRAGLFRSRTGYDPGFLGDGERLVELPQAGLWGADVAPAADDENGVLRYRHFSVVQSKSRRLALFTAVNIDGSLTIRLKRKGTWRFDGRLAREHQIGNELYRHNALDRGHMVRRRDPGWGEDRQTAREGEDDAFHYTNCAPQHKDLNQREWLRLEDYILEAAETRGFRVSVFTGPVFRSSDRCLKDQPGAEDVQIPEEFWKVAVMVKEGTGRLSATGYVLTQGRMIRHMTEAAFVFGEYQTYQVQVAKIEAETGLDFGRLRDFDPMGADLSSVETFGQQARLVDGPRSVTL